MSGERVRGAGREVPLSARAAGSGHAEQGGAGRIREPVEKLGELLCSAPVCAVQECTPGSKG